MAALLGGALLAAQGLGVGGAVRAFQPLFYHLLMVGWAAYGGLNAGLLLRALAEPAHTLGQRGWTGPGDLGAAPGGGGLAAGRGALAQGQGQTGEVKRCRR